MTTKNAWADTKVSELKLAFVLEKNLTGMIFEKYTRTQAMAKVIPRFRDLVFHQ